MRRRLSGPSAPLFVPLSLAALLIAASILASCAGKALGGNQGGSGNGGSAASPVTPTISWPTPSPIANTTPLTSTQLDATASVPGTFVYTPAAGTVLTAGTHALSVAFTPANPAGYNDASASVTITINPALTSPSAYVYVSGSANASTAEVYAFSAASDGTLTPVAGSPFSTIGGLQATNGKLLFGGNGIDIDSYSVAADGTFLQVASINAQALNSKDLNGGACGGPTALFPDHTGTVLYDLDFYSDCANNAYQLFSVDRSSGSLSYIGVTSVTTPIFEVPLSFLGNNQFAYGASCYHWYQEIFGFTRNRDGSLTSLGVNPTLGPPMPVSQAGQMYCPYLTATDPTNHLAVPVQPLDNSSLQPVGPYQLATYTADSSGNLTTTSTYSNMPTTSVTTNSSLGSLTNISMSPSGQLLAVAGTLGLQVFHFNAANPITPYTSALITGQVDQIFWDNHDHLYAISQSAGKLFVLTVTPTSNSQAPGSPYTITSPANLVVLSQ
jgi:hypothetical protein